MHATDAVQMTAEQRLDEIADILAAGFLRLRRRPGHIPDAQNRPVSPAENTFQSPAQLAGCFAAPSA